MFRFTIRDVLLATFWVALCCAAWRVHDNFWKNDGDAFYFAMLSFRYFPMPAAVGALFGRAGVGLGAGLGLYWLWVAISLFLLYNNFVVV